MKLPVLLFLLLPVHTSAQSAYKTGDVVPDLVIKKIINHKSNSSSLKKMGSTITIIDFFGTWCAPCIKALPELAAYKNKFKDDISILLVSTETESKLAKFINSRQPFIFPMVVDEDNFFISAFAPPSYPYTVVLDQHLKIVSVTNAAGLSDKMLEKFIEEGKTNMAYKPAAPANVVQPKANIPTWVYAESSNYLVKISQDFMYAAKTHEETTTYINQLKELAYPALLTGLQNDNDRKAFWINLYNAYTNAALYEDPEQYKSRNTFFKNKNIIVAGKLFSLDKIEHGILRRSKIKWSLGYFSKLFPSKTEKELRVDTLDYRIHFALNCGAKSCPPIAFYDPEHLHAQLDVAATAYLRAETSYDAKTRVLRLPAILSWFRRDFGGKKKIIELLKTEQLLEPDVNPKIKFRKYDWTLYTDNYKK